ncbi:hypothetical protein GOP47_0005480 [Adiantum capillus-veneris]|uniref:Programmed cell death protein 2 C-terminal domain-containing protein n=1 Tax=Adiantum capillus-veneris TaxID=13818 RepID=A0A9D4V638_ADICA|nr:hypothetical protein GOP47_0005480 [Adiantum capillus-veneris]
MGRPLPSNLAASQSEAKEVILGMPGPWAEDNIEPSDHYTTKVGGVPDWPMHTEEIDSEFLRCGVCGGDLGLVAQVYAPLKIRDVEIDERTLYIFGCPSSSCGIGPLSWRTLRVQGSPSSEHGRRNMSSSAEASTSSAQEVLREDMSEQGRESSSDHQHHGDEWWEDDTWGPGVVGRIDAEQEAFLAMEELETALLEAGYAAAVPLTSTLDSGEEFTAVNEDLANESDGPDLPVLPCFYVYSQHESHPSRGSRAVSALQITERAETAERDELNRREEMWEGEEYEHDRALSADRTYLKFKKRLDCYPEQCFRYCFKGKPLWASKDGVEPGVCAQCGGPRVYEMQLMPPLLYYLQQACKDLPSTAYSPNDWEWLTLVVFTCGRSCTPCLSPDSGAPYGESKPWIVVEEAIVLQYET